MNNKKMQKVFENYKMLGESEQNKILSHIDSVWRSVYDEYSELCLGDPELCEAYDALEKARIASLFSWEDHYYVTLYTENEFDPDNATDVYEYSLELQEEARCVYENLGEINAPLIAKLEELKKQKDQLQKEIEELKNKRKLFKQIKISAYKSKISHLESEISSVECKIKSNKNKAAHYAKCNEMHEEKQKYATNYETMVAPHKKLYDERTKKYAKQVVEKYLEEEPVLICKEQKSRIYVSNKRSFSSEALNDACNSVRNEVLFGIRNKGEEKI